MGDRAPAPDEPTAADGQDRTPRSDAALDPESLAWRRSYDRRSIEEYARAVAEERERLLAEVAVAEERIAAAKRAIAEREASDERVMAGVVAAAQAEIERIEDERDDAVHAIEVEAEREAVRLLDEARAAAAAIDESLVSVRWRLEAGKFGAVVGSAGTAEAAVLSEEEEDGD